MRTRVMLVNTSDTNSFDIGITTKESVSSCELLPTTLESEPEGPTTDQPASTLWTLHFGPGEIHGFATSLAFDISHPYPTEIVVYTSTANGKDPWPQPPPPQTVKFSNLSPAAFHKRTTNFLLKFLK